MTEIYRSIDAIIAARREKANNELADRKMAVYKKIPQLLLIDEKIMMSGIQYAKTLVRDSALMDADALSHQIAKLIGEKADLLKKNGYAADYLEPKFVCPICKDTGLMRAKDSFETKPCTCYRQLYLDKHYQVSNLLDDGETGFCFFDDNFYSDIPDKKRYASEISPREQIRKIKAHCLNFMENFNNLTTANLYFFGSAGTGKTFIAKSLGLELLKRGYTVLYLSAPTLFEIIRKIRFSSDGDGYNDATYKNLVYTQLLILDDLGTEPASDARYAEFLTLLEARKSVAQRQTSKTIISSNLNTKSLYQEYNERIASRIAGEFDALQFFGDDIRILKKYH